MPDCFDKVITGTPTATTITPRQSALRLDTPTQPPRDGLERRARPIQMATAGCTSRMPCPSSFSMCPFEPFRAVFRMMFGA